MAEENSTSDGELFFSLIITSPPETESLDAIISAIGKILEENLPQHYEIILLDDDDSVLNKATEMSKSYPQLRVFKYTGPTPVATGWEQAHGNVLAVIDGDLRQPPNTLSDIVTALKKGSDLAMTVQYKEGSKKNGEDSLSFLAIQKETLPKINESTKGYQLILEILGPENIKKMTEASTEESGKGGRILSHIQTMMGKKEE